MANINQIEVENVIYDVEDNATRTASRVLVTDSSGKIDESLVTISELNILDGATVSTNELNYLDGVTSSVQNQINTKIGDAPSDGSEYVRKNGAWAVSSGGGTVPSHTQAASTITGGTFSGSTAVKANSSAESGLTTMQVRNIQASTTDLTAGTSSLTTGEIYLVYE